MQRPQAKQHLSGLQQVLLRWLYTGPRRRCHMSEAGGVPYAGIVRAVSADKLSITTSLRQLMRKGLVLIVLPRGSWSRCVILTEQGKEYAGTLVKAEGRKPPAKRLTERIEEPIGEKRRRHIAARRREREREIRQKRSDKRSQQRWE